MSSVSTCVSLLHLRRLLASFTVVWMCACVCVFFSLFFVIPKVSERVCAAFMKSSSLSPTWAGLKRVLGLILYVIMNSDLTLLWFISVFFLESWETSTACWKQRQQRLENVWIKSHKHANLFLIIRMLIRADSYICNTPLSLWSQRLISDALTC